VPEAENPAKKISTNIPKVNAVVVSQARADVEPKKSTVEVKEEEKLREPAIFVEPVVHKNSESNDSQP